MLKSIVSANFLKCFCQQDLLPFTSLIFKFCCYNENFVFPQNKERNRSLGSNNAIFTSQVCERCFLEKFFLYARRSSPKSSRPVRSEPSSGSSSSQMKENKNKEYEQNSKEDKENEKKKSEHDLDQLEKLKEKIRDLLGKDKAKELEEETNKLFSKYKFVPFVQLAALITFILYILINLFSYLNDVNNTYYLDMDKLFQKIASGHVSKIILVPDSYISKKRSRPIIGKAILFSSFQANDKPIGAVLVSDLHKFSEKVRIKELELDIPPERWVNIYWEKTNPFSYLFPIFLLAIFFGLPIYLTTRFSKKIDFNDLFSSGQRFRIIDPTSKEGKKNLKIKFRDVAGLHEAKGEVMEIVDYLRKPQKYAQLGARLPKGALLTGPPGCGKTLLAKALAAESSVPFINVNGTEFVEMIGGLGASRVRQLFKTAKSSAPCIIYIDEIDALGRKRENESSGNDEMEQTLNQLLVEMDGMDSYKGVVVVGSTNRVDMLDKALLRPGRFDRHITIDLPTLLERVELFDLYLQKIKRENLLTGVSHRLAQMTPGFSGADIKNVVNEAAIHAATTLKKMVKISDVDFALQKIIAGPEKRSRFLIKEEREIVAFHESGHALVGWLLEHTEALLRISIIPRTSATLGFAQYSPKDRKLFTKEELFDRMCMVLGGRAAENVTFGRITTGAQNDLEKVTKQAQAMVKWYGMNELIGPISFFPGQGVDLRSADFNEKPYSKKLGNLIDQEIGKLVADAYYSTERLLRENKDKLEVLANALLERETLNYEDVKRLIGPPKFANKQVVDLPEDVLPDLPNNLESEKENNNKYSFLFDNI